MVYRLDDGARAAIAAGLPQGRFSGVPFLLKDLDLHLAEAPLTNGSRLFGGFVPDRDSTLVVWSWDEVTRVDPEAGGVCRPGVSDGFERCSPPYYFEVLGEVVGPD